MSTKLTYGQKKAGLSLTETVSNTQDDVVYARLHFANLYDALNNKRNNITDPEAIRLISIAEDDLTPALQHVIKVLTFGKT